MNVRDYSAYLVGMRRDRARAFANELPFKEWPLIYRAGCCRDPLTGLSERCVDATCSRCHKTMKLPYVPGAHGYTSCDSFGFWSYEKNKACGSGSELNCPCCGQRVTAVHVSRAEGYLRSWSFCMELGRVQYKKKRDAFVVMLWRIYRHFDKQAQQLFDIEPYEAYVVEDDKIVCFKHWRTLFYNTFITDEWRQNARFTDTAYDVYSGEIIGDLHEAMLGTTVENSKLDLYMMQAETPFPISYLRLWQKHPNVETLLTIGAGRLLGSLIKEAKNDTSRGYYPAYKNSAPMLPECDWKARRPNEILRMNRAEFRAVREANLNGEQMMTLLISRKAGIRLRLPDDIPDIKNCNVKVWGRIIRAGVWWTQADRYLKAQRKRYPEESTNSASYLADYWNMVQTAGENITDHATRWPQHLAGAHNQLLLRMKFKESEELRARFERRAAALEKYRFEADGLLICQPMSESDLIREGKFLNHCIATYAERHAKGETTIMFIRRAEKPNVPYFTLNINERRMTVIENHGKNNCKPTDEVNLFVNLFMEWVRDGRKKDKDGKPILPKKEKVAVVA